MPEYFVDPDFDDEENFLDQAKNNCLQGHIFTI